MIERKNCYYAVNRIKSDKAYESYACYSSVFDRRVSLLNGNKKFDKLIAILPLSGISPLTIKEVRYWLRYIKKLFGGITYTKIKDVKFNDYFSNGSEIEKSICVYVNPYKIKNTNNTKNIFLLYKSILTLIRYTYEYSSPRLLKYIIKRYRNSQKISKNINLIDLLINAHSLKLGTYIFTSPGPGHAFAHTLYIPNLNNNYITLDVEKFINEEPADEHPHINNSRPHINNSIKKYSKIIEDEKIIKILNELYNNFKK